MTEPPTLSVVSPVFHGQETVEALVRRIRDALHPAGISHEIILVDDACPCDSWNAIRTVCRQHPEVVGIRLAQNVGQHRALRAGLKQSRGRFMAVMDCDLQDDPGRLPELLAKAREGFGVVYARRERRQDPAWRYLASRIFRRLVSLLSGLPPVDRHRGMYTVIPRATLDLVLAGQGPNCPYLFLLQQMRLPSADVDVVHQPSAFRKSSYSLMALFRLFAVDIALSGARRFNIPIGPPLTDEPYAIRETLNAPTQGPGRGAPWP